MILRIIFCPISLRSKLSYKTYSAEYIIILNILLFYFSYLLFPCQHIYFQFLVAFVLLLTLWDTHMLVFEPSFSCISVLHGFAVNCFFFRFWVQLFIAEIYRGTLLHNTLISRHVGTHWKNYKKGLCLHVIHVVSDMTRAFVIIPIIYLVWMFFYV